MTRAQQLIDQILALRASEPRERRIVAAWWWIDRWRQSTACCDMSAAEQGLYRNLCDEVWVREALVIPDDSRILAKVSGDHRAWGKVGQNVLKWMTKVEGGWTNETALEVILESEQRAQRQARYRNARRNGRRNEERNEQHNEPANGPRDEARNQAPSPSPSRSRSQRENDQEEEDAREAPAASEPRPIVPSPELVTAGNDLVAQVAERHSLDPVNVVRRASWWNGSSLTRLDLARNDVRLEHTVDTLRTWLRTGQTPEQQRTNAAGSRTGNGSPRPTAGERVKTAHEAALEILHQRAAAREAAPPAVPALAAGGGNAR